MQFLNNVNRLFIKKITKKQYLLYLSRMSTEIISENPMKKQKITNAKDTIISKTEEFVKKELQNNDGSHDWHHINRVRKLAISLAHEEKITALDVVELAALLHDIKDWKYSGSDTAGSKAAEDFLKENNFSEEKTNIITNIISNIGFKKELGNSNIKMFPELAVVRDADRLDAIGAIGIGRCFTYGGSKNQPMYDPEYPPNPELTQADYIKQGKGGKNPTINHFYEKLLKLKDLMVTEAGRRRAIKRHEFMKIFLNQFYEECEGKS